MTPHSSQPSTVLHARRRSAFALVLALCGLNGAPRAEDASDGSPKYLGVVTCAGSTCHGASHAGSDTRILQSEFLVWHRDDAHAQAYRVLLEEKGQRIARNLGLANAAEAPECLSCHSTFVPPAVRGKRFQLADGVGCESCHGPASEWLGLHVTGESSREENLKAGMYRTEEPHARASLCLSCHLGALDKFATHRIMGAGHPRLAFELDTFTLLQPAHFRIDADYRARKQVASHVQVWATGQAAAATRSFELFLSEQWQGTGALPEFAFFDCHACHHPLAEPRWTPRATTGLPPGVVRINDASVLMLLYLTRVIQPPLADELHAALLGLHQASTASREATRAAATALKAVIAEVETEVRGHAFDADQTKTILASIVRGGIDGEYRDFAAAEQAVMAVHALVDTLVDAKIWTAPQAAAVDTQIKILDALLEDQNAYQAARFSAALQTLATALK